MNFSGRVEVADIPNPLPAKLTVAVAVAVCNLICFTCNRRVRNTWCVQVVRPPNCFSREWK